ncbi:plasmid partitioning protein RepB [Rhizobium sp. LARHSG275]|uniref:plasmid partitioning protein RepB n=1 Tax=Rhizobium TaxID=379 RepID=UPI001389C8C5|nr:plasmid partitioning protein RepB [Rhizobium laguerreae]NDK49959.1 plasmid partitioning protein RepB [Rhizobium laguerreae]
MSRKDTVNSLFMRKTEPPAAGASASKTSERVRSGAISAMGTSLQEMSEGARAAARLQEQLSAGHAVIEIDPAMVSDSSVGDRISIEVDPGFEELVSSIGRHGQQVPILVRPVTGRADWYQIAYGRRRLRAASRLGAKVRAIVRNLSDDELVIAQGKENLDRQDLSFIEKALFALRLEEAGYKRETILSALSTDKADLSRYISIARILPQSIVQAIGPAPKAGRSRWMALAETMSASGKKIEALIAEPAFLQLPSDERFAKALAVAATPKKKASGGEHWRNAKGQKAARIERIGKTTRISFDERVVPEFAAFLTDKLEALHAEFEELRRDR